MDNLTSQGHGIYVLIIQGIDTICILFILILILFIFILNDRTAAQSLAFKIKL